MESIIFRAVRVHATIDGRPVDVSDWAADSSVNWGDRTFTGQVPEAVTWAEQEAPLVLWLSDDTQLWAGKLTQNPRTERGVRHVRAEGYANQISAAKTRMFYRIDGGSQWVDGEGDPHQFANAEDIDLNIGPGVLRWQWGNGNDAFAVGDFSQALIWVEGATISRFEFLSEASPAGNTTFQMRSRTGTGPSGSTTLIWDHSLNITSQLRTQDVTDGGDMLLLGVRCVAAVTPGGRRRATARQLKVYGRTTDDAFSASEVVADVGADAGFDTSGVQANGRAILPLDWTEDNTSLLSYMAELTDSFWMAEGPEVVGASPRLRFGPFEDTWTAYLSNDVVATLEPMRRYNRVRVPYTTLADQKREVEASPTADPFPGSEVVWIADELEDPQPNSDLADGVASTLAEHYASERVAGRLQLGRVVDATGAPRSPYKVKPGTLVNMPDSGLPPQRIASVNYRPDGDVSADLNDDFNVVRLLADLRSDRPSNRRKKRRRRR